jgi:DNA-binding transcriptional LysR family regulator
VRTRRSGWAAGNESDATGECRAAGDRLRWLAYLGDRETNASKPPSADSIAHIPLTSRPGIVHIGTVASPAAFAIWWLVPRLGRFAALHPDIEVRIATIDGHEPDLLRDGIDVAIVKRPAKEAARNPFEMPLLSEIVFPICSPSLLKGASLLRNSSDLARHPLIECDAA